MPKTIKINLNRKGERQKAIFFFSTLLSIFIVVAFLPRLSIPLLITYFFFLIFRPLLPFLCKKGLNKNASLALVFSMFLFFLFYPLIRFIPTLIADSQNLKYYVPKVQDYVLSSFVKVKQEVYQRTGYLIEDTVLQDVLSSLVEISKELLKSLPQILGSVFEWIFVVPLFFFFLMKDSERLKNLFLSLAPSSYFERAYYVIYSFNRQVGDYIFAKFVEACIVGIIVTVGLVWMGMNFSLLLGIIAAATNVIPYLGPFLGLIPAVVVVLVEHGVGPQLGGMLILYGVANAIDLALVFPLLVSKIVNLHPIVVVVSVIVGSHFWGLLGMVICIPLAATLKLILGQIYQEFYTDNPR